MLNLVNGELATIIDRMLKLLVLLVVDFLFYTVFEFVEDSVRDRRLMLSSLLFVVRVEVQEVTVIIMDLHLFFMVLFAF